jgi:hypothetical protein
VPEPKCEECGKTEREHELCCPEDLSVHSNNDKV